MWAIASWRELEKSMSQAAQWWRLNPRRPGDDQNTGADPRGELAESRFLKCERGNQLYELSAFKQGLARSIISGHLTISSTFWPACSLFLDLIGKVRRIPFCFVTPYIQADVVFVVSEFMSVCFSTWNRGGRIQLPHSTQRPSFSDCPRQTEVSRIPEMHRWQGHGGGQDPSTGIAGGHRQQSLPL